jgi:hypothetical protein
MPGKSIIILLAGMVLITGFILVGILKTSNNISKNTVTDYQKKTTYNIAQSGANIGLNTLKFNSGYRNTSFTVVDMMGGKVNIRVIDSTLNGSSQAVVKSTGFTNYGNANQISYTSVAILPNAIPTNIHGAFTATAGVTYKFNGQGEIDGRNYNPDNTLITSPANTGTYAIWTKGSVTIPGNSSSIGGTSYPGTMNAQDIVPSSDINPLIVLQNQQVPINYPTNPDQVMGGINSGYPDGTLKSIAQSGINGSQYQQSFGGKFPNYTSPLKGVTYFDWTGGNIGSLNGSGILIINNLSSQNLSLSMMHENFSGLVILSNNISLSLKQGGIVGSLIFTAPSSGGDTLALLSDNAKGFIHYSSQAIINGTQNLPSSKVIWFEH